MAKLKKLKSVTAVRGKPYVLRLIWTDGRVTIVDMSGTVHRLKAFAPLRDPRVFRKVRVISEGLGVGWANDLDYSARSLQMLLRPKRTVNRSL